jgi:hypothetical protein
MTYYDWYITHSEVMSWVSRQAKILIPEGLESRLSVGIRRILMELLHSTKLELWNLRRTQTDSGRAFTLELLCGLPTSREVLWTSEPHLSLYSTRMNLGAL